MTVTKKIGTNQLKTKKWHPIKMTAEKNEPQCKIKNAIYKMTVAKKTEPNSWKK